MLAGIVVTSFQCGGQAGQGPQNLADNTPPIAVVGKMNVTAVQVDEVFQQQAQQFAAIGPLPPALEASGMASAVDAVVSQAISVEFARSKNAMMAEDQVKAAMDRLFQQELETTREQMLATGQLKANATEKEFQDAYQKTQGRSVDQYRQEVTGRLTEALNNPQRKPLVLASLGLNELVRRNAAANPPSEADVRASFNTWELKRILINAQGAGTGTPAAKAAQVLAEVRGGLDFARAMERFSNEPAPPGKKVSDNTVTLRYATILGDPALAPLKALKPNGISEVVELPEGAAIYRLVKVTPNLPKDFDAQKARYTRQVAEEIAQAQANNELREFRKTAKIDWKDDGYRVLYEYAQLRADAMTPATDRTKLKELLEKANGAMNSQMGARAAVLARFAIFNDLYAGATPLEQSQMRDQRIEIYQSMLMSNENIQLRLELARMSLDAKKGTEFFDHLRQAAQTNELTMGPIGQSNHSSIESLINRGRTAGILTAEQVAEITKSQAAWIQNKTEQEKMEAEQRKAMEQQQKEMEKANAPTPQRREVPTTPSAPAPNTSPIPGAGTTGG